jgi:tRNA threonylcarbamoyl adenosine modification protein YeaZ
VAPPPRRVLAIDTTGGELLIALVDTGGGPSLVAGLAEAGGRHQDRVISAITEVVGAAGLGDLDAIAVARGPGSHTGLRVGLSTAEGLAFARRLEIYPLSSLAVAAHRARLDSGTVLAMVAAGRGRVHAQTFDCGAGRRGAAEAAVVVQVRDLDAGAMVAGEAVLLAQAADLGYAVAPIVPGPDALAAATIEAAGDSAAVAYDELRGEYGELSMEQVP